MTFTLFGFFKSTLSLNAGDVDRFGVCFEMGKKLHSIALIMELNDCCVIFFILAGFDFVQG